MKSVFIAHLLLAVAPLGRALAPSNIISGMPIHYALGAISVSQALLLSIYVGMFVAPTRNKLLVAAIGIAYIAVWQTIGEGLEASSLPRGSASIFFVSSAYLQFIRSNVSIVVIFAVVAACVRRLIGSIRIPEFAASATIRPRTQYSLLALQLVLAIATLFMALARTSRLSVAPSNSMVSPEFSLLVVVFGSNIVAAVWATLGTGPVTRKLALVVVVSAILGLALAVSSSHDKLGWWVMTSYPLLTLVSTLVIAATLYSLRLSGFRLDRFTAKTPRTRTFSDATEA